MHACMCASFVDCPCVWYPLPNAFSWLVTVAISCHCFHVYFSADYCSSTGFFCVPTMFVSISMSTNIYQCSSMFSYVIYSCISQFCESMMLANGLFESVRSMFACFN